jgi:nitrogen fixation/metabolism regulation signal transduction histidine kinase
MHRSAVARALTARMGRRFANLATLIVTGIFFLFLLVIAALSYFFSPWWWLLMIPAVILVLIFVIIRIIVGLILHQIHGGKLTSEQQSGLDGFIDKVQQLLEARATPLPLLALICVKDIVFHKDITTVKKIIHDTANLRHDYQELERLFD